MRLTAWTCSSAGCRAATVAGAAVEATLNELGLSVASSCPPAACTENDFNQERSNKALYTDMSYDLGETLPWVCATPRDDTELGDFSRPRSSATAGARCSNTISGDALDPQARVADRRIDRGSRGHR